VPRAGAPHFRRATVMRLQYINPFVSALSNTFRTMLSCELHHGELKPADGNHPRYELSGIIGITGGAVGTLVLNLSRKVALHAASTLLMMESTEIDDDVIDAVGELTNIVAGRAKSELEDYRLSIGLPNVICGSGYKVRFPSNIQPICVPCECEWGALTLEVGLAAVAQPVVC
jgi:chemotaxis protein CheX